MLFYSILIYLRFSGVRITLKNAIENVCKKK